MNFIFIIFVKKHRKKKKDIYYYYVNSSTKIEFFPYHTDKNDFNDINPKSLVA